MPVVVVMDEVDRVFGCPYQNDFFGLLRFWYDQRAFDSRWEKLNLVLACSIDPYQAINDLTQSPLLFSPYTFNRMPVDIAAQLPAEAPCGRTEPCPLQCLTAITGGI